MLTDTARKLIKTRSNLNVLFPILYMLGIFLFSSNIHHRHPISKHLFSNHGLNNLLHIPAYGGLTLLWFWVIRKKLENSIKSLFYASAIAFSYGVFEEIHQSLILGRSASVFDVILNIIGITLAVLTVRKCSLCSHEHDENRLMK